jgi:hypothetical protein
MIPGLVNGGPGIISIRLWRKNFEREATRMQAKPIKLFTVEIAGSSSIHMMLPIGLMAATAAAIVPVLESGS